MQLLEHPWQFLAGNVKQHRVGEDAIEVTRR